MRTSRLFWYMGVTVIVVSISAAHASATHAWGKTPTAADIDIRSLAPDPRGGKAYQLVYLVAVTPDTYWRFKTDFDNEYLTKNKYIEAHRVVNRGDRKVVSESVYTYDPDHRFRWQTTILPEQRRLDFRLINAKACNQIFHYGSIQIEAAGNRTRVVQTAYFDFWGVGLWYRYPWAGGMREFLRYNAKWEQGLAAELGRRYAPHPTPPGEVLNPQHDW